MTRDLQTLFAWIGALLMTFAIVTAVVGVLIFFL